MDPPKPSRPDEISKPDQQVIQNAEQFAEVYNNNDDDQYYGGGGGCFTGDSKIMMADGSLKRVDCIKKGDLVASGLDKQKQARVLCLLRSTCNTGKTNLCTLNTGLKITSGHPVFFNGEWQYPRDIVAPKEQTCNAVYNLIIEKDHIVECDGIALILPGHNYKHGILKHDYLGS